MRRWRRPDDRRLAPSDHLPLGSRLGLGRGGSPLPAVSQATGALAPAVREALRELVEAFDARDQARETLYASLDDEVGEVADAALAAASARLKRARDVAYAVLRRGAG